MKTLTPVELSAWLSDPCRQPPVLLDVREPHEVALASLPGSMTIPMAEIPVALETLDSCSTIVCICHHGMRSMQVARFLVSNGFSSVYNLNGGVHRWAVEVDSSFPIY